jgi:hypothetical protein
MKVAIISDVHDNLVNLEKYLKWCGENKIEEIIMCGDLCAPATLARVLAPKFSGKIHMVFGNVSDRETERKVAKKFPNVIHYGDEGEFEIDGKKVAIIHYPIEAKALAQSGKFDFIFYGHSHKPWIEKIGNAYLANPGTLSGMFQKATFAVWDTESEKMELKLLENI